MACLCGHDSVTVYLPGDDPRSLRERTTRPRECTDCASSGEIVVLGTDKRFDYKLCQTCRGVGYVIRPPRPFHPAPGF